MIGQTLAHYKVIDLLGKGGMGSVYRAQDTKLGREVALKLMADDFANDPERLARFRREAKVLASLSHANIAAIHGLEEADGRVFLIMELAEGEDLSRRLSNGPLSVDEVVSLARQLAEGMEQAHERGVVHRDLKPANVMMSDEGAVKILDFGLARAYAGESPTEGELQNSPTITAAMTQVGTILGTAAYMSPEQARGREVDRRADIWAFGVILYEALTGVRLFEGESVSDTLAGVLKTEPDFETLPSDTPIALRWLIERCLQKQPSSRLRDIGEARILLQSDLDQLPASTMAMQAVGLDERPRWVIPALVGVALVAALAGALGARLFSGSPAPAPMIHATLQAPVDHAILDDAGGHVALSPDGSRVAFVAVDSLDVQRLWVRRLDSSAAFQMTGTEEASYPFWSPDGDMIGFFVPGSLRKIAAAGGVATTVSPAETGRGGSWTTDDRILFAPGPNAGIHIVSAGGGTPMAISATDSVTSSHRWPHALPDGKHFLFTKLGSEAGVVWMAIDDPSQTRLVSSGIIEGRYFGGQLLFGRDNALWAQPFSPETGEFLGQERLLAERVQNSRNFGGAVYSATDGGHLVYAVGLGRERTTLGVYAMEGETIEEFEPSEGFVNDLDLSPDGRYLALTVYSTEDEGGADIWIRDLQRGTVSRFTNQEGADDPVWSPSQDQIAYSTGSTITIRSTSGSRPVIRTVKLTSDLIPHDWSEDGQFLLASHATSANREIVVIPIDESEDPWVLVPAEGRWNGHPIFSYDGQWVTYMSVETGEPQIYLREFRRDGSSWQVSSTASIMPRFGPNDESIHYLHERGRTLMSVPLTVVNGRPEFGLESRGLDIPVVRERSNTHLWTMDRTGTRVIAFVDHDTPDHATGPPLELIVGWPQMLGSE